MEFNKQENDQLIKGKGARQRASGAICYNEEYVKIVRKHSEVAFEKYFHGEDFGQDGASELLFLSALVMKPFNTQVSQVIFELGLALEDLSKGQQAEILKPTENAKTPNRPPAPISSNIEKARISTAIELYYKANGNLDQAARWAAKLIKGWKLPKTKQNITHKTLLGWRKECMESSVDNHHGHFYRTVKQQHLDECRGDKEALLAKAHQLIGQGQYLEKT